MASYYDYEPLVELDAPIFLTGYVQGDTRAVAHRLAALSGLPFSDLERKVEHHARASVAEVIATQGVEHFRQLEKEQLIRELRDRPFGIVTLGDGTLSHPECLRLALDGGRVVLLDLDLPNCFWRLQARGETESDPWHPTQPGPLTCLAELRPFYQARQPSFAEAHRRFDMRGQHPSRMAEVLLAELDNGL